MARHVFISHSHQDTEFATLLLEALEAQQVPCWIAPRDVTPGGSYAECILTAIENSSCFVLIYTRGSNDSRHVLREVERALSLGINIIPVRFDDAPVSKSLDYLLATVHWLSVLPRNRNAALRKAAEQIRGCAVVPPAGAPAAAGYREREPHSVKNAPSAARRRRRTWLLLGILGALLLLVSGVVAYIVWPKANNHASSDIAGAMTAEPAAGMRSAAPPASGSTTAGTDVAALRPLATAGIQLPVRDSSPPPQPSKNDGVAQWLIPDSSERLLTFDELRSYSKEMLSRAHDELFARRGLIFSTERGRRHAAFLGSSYRGTELDQNRVITQMTAIEQKNVSLLNAMEIGKVRLGMVQDPDGFTNVRANPSLQAAVVARANDRETVQILGKTGSWFSVISLGPGYKGYVHESRVRILQ